MQDFLKNLYKSLYKEDLIKTVIQTVEVEKPLPIVLKTNGEKLYDLAFSLLGTDPTPKDEQPDPVACVHSLTTILRKQLPDFPIMTYTPDLLVKLRSDLRFKPSNEFKLGNIVLSPTNTGNGSILGHVGLVGRNGDILSNASSTGLWDTKFNQTSWIERYSRQGKLALYIFEML